MCDCSLVGDCVGIDASLRAQVWAKYATTAKLLAKEGESEGVPLGKYLCSTIVENAPMMADLLGVVPVVWLNTYVVLLALLWWKRFVSV